MSCVLCVSCIGMHVIIHVVQVTDCRLAIRPTGYPTDLLSDRLTIRPTGYPTEWLSERRAIRPTCYLTDWQSDRLAISDRVACLLSDWRAIRPNGYPIDWLSDQHPTDDFTSYPILRPTGYVTTAAAAEIWYT